METWDGTMTRDVPPEHLAFLRGALPKLKADTRLVGVAAAGSWITNQLDEFSDLDLVIAIAPESVDRVMAEREILARGLGHLVGAFTGEHVGEPRLLVCLYVEPLLHVDLKFVALPDMAKRVEDPVVLWERDGALSDVMAKTTAKFPGPDAQWIEDRFWIWVHYAATKLGRGELFEVVDFLAYLRGQVLAPIALVQAGHQPRGVRRLECLLPEQRKMFEGTLAELERNSASKALEQCVHLYRQLREAAQVPGLERRRDAESVAVRYLQQIMKR